jgi:endo-1,4-beta-xylanase
VNQANAARILGEHISTVAGHYAGRVHSWDVVNEAIEWESGRADGLRNSPWLHAIGPGYIELAFTTAAKADPHALLVWNEDWLEEDSPRGEHKRTFVLSWLRSLQAKRIPVHALGIQGHLVGSHSNIATANFSAFLRRVADLGLKIMVTELDVRDDGLPQDTRRRDEVVAEKYAGFLNAILHERAAIAVVTWGLSNRYTWLSRFAPRADGKHVRPLPFDEELHQTPCRGAIGRALASRVRG